MHPDDDGLDAFEPYTGPDRRTPQHCQDHSGNMQFYRSVSTRLNVCLSMVTLILGAMAYLLLTQIETGKLSVSHSELLKQNTSDIAEIQKELMTLRQQQAENSQFRAAWVIKESLEQHK